MGTAKRIGFMLTGNFTETGSPAYRTPEQQWTSDVQKAQLFEQEPDAEAVVVSARKQEQRLVTDPYVCKVRLTDDGGFELMSARERIRATGPTTPVRRPDR